jgi:hypothetical protein
MSGILRDCVFQPIYEDDVIVGVEIDIGEKDGEMSGCDFSGFPNWQFWKQGIRLYVDDKGRPESDGLKMMSVFLR